MIIKIEKSPKPNKRYRVTMDNNKTYDFGLENPKYGTYIDHHDKIKRFNYVKRHMANKIENYSITNLVPSPALFSMLLLWGPYTDLHKNIDYLNNLWKEKHFFGAGNGIMARTYSQLVSDIESKLRIIRNMHFPNLNDERNFRDQESFVSEQLHSVLYNIRINNAQPEDKAILRDLLNIVTRMIPRTAEADIIPIANAHIEEPMTMSFDNEDAQLPRATTGKGNKNAGYVRRMEAESKLLLHKVTNPSKHLQNKYGNQQQQDPQPEYEQPIFNEHENVEFNVGKPKKKTTKNKQPTEAEEERQQAQYRKELEENQNKIKKLENLKAQLVECRKELGQENSKFMDVLEEVRTRKGMKKSDRTELEQAVRSKYVKNIDKIKTKYTEVFQYIKNNRLNDNDLNSVHKEINNKINQLSK